jgi:hypothetical protein
MRIGFSLGVIVASLFFGSIALAHGPEPEKEAKPEETKPGEKDQKEAEGKEHGEEAEASWEVAGDLAVGFANTDILTAGQPGRREATPENTFDSSRVTTLTFLLGLEHAISEHVIVGAKIPFIEGNISSRSGLLSNRDGIFIAGNLELGGTYKMPLGKNELELTMEVALPTGAGVDQPSKEEVEADPTKTYQYNRLDKAAVMRAANFATGSINSALYEPGRIGVTPKAQLPMRFGKLSIVPMVKVENLIDVTGDAGQTYVGELIIAANAFYRVHKYVEPGLAAWANILYTKAEIDNPSIIALQPYVRFPVGALKPYVGATLPVFGHIIDDKAFAINGGLVAEF